MSETTNDIDAAVDALPVTTEEITATLIQSLGGVWQDFLAHLPLLIVGLVVLLLTWIVAAIFGRVGANLFRRTELRPSLQELFVRLSTILIWVLGLLLVAMVVFPGLTPTRALGGLGIASVAIGFAFKDIFENFFAGVLLLWRFPIELGDFIECDGIMGEVEAINVRQTEIRTPDGRLVVVPNSKLFSNPVEVLTNRAVRRQTIVTGIAYDEGVEEAVPIIEDAVRKCDTVLDENGIEVFPLGFGDSSIDIEVCWWSRPRPLEMRRSRGEVVTAIKRALDQAGIEIPFPYRTLTFKETLTVAQAPGSEE